jgi:hypothetical protein
VKNARAGMRVGLFLSRPF